MDSGARSTSASTHPTLVGLPTARPRLVSIVRDGTEILRTAPLAAALDEHVDEVLVHGATAASPGRPLGGAEPEPLPDALDLGPWADELQLRVGEARIGRVLERERPDAVLVHGHSNTTLAGARAAIERFLPLIHVEAGLRSHRGDLPEERNRVLTDHQAGLLLAPTAAAGENLRVERVCGAIHVTGDVTCDMLKRWEPLLPDVAPTGDYVLAVIDCGRVTDDGGRAAAVLDCLAAAPLPVLLPVVPRTRELMTQAGLRAPANVTLLDALPYTQLLALEHRAAAIVTDGAGAQREAYVYGVPCVTLRDETEWVETVRSGWNVLAGVDRDRLLAALARPRPSEHPPIFGDGRAAERIAALVAEFIAGSMSRGRRWAS